MTAAIAEAEAADRAVTTAEDRKAAEIAAGKAAIIADRRDKAAEIAADKAASAEDLLTNRVRNNLHRKEAETDDITKKSQVP